MSLWLALKECVFVWDIWRKLGGTILWLMRHIKLKMKKVSFLNLWGGWAINANYFWLELLYRITFTNFGVCLISCCQKSLTLQSCLITGSRTKGKRRRSKLLTKNYNKKTFIWSSNSIKFWGRSCCVELSYKCRNLCPLRNKFIFLWD